MNQTQKRWLVLLKGVIEGVDSLTEDEVRDLLREKHLRYFAEDATGIVSDLADILAEKRLKHVCARMAPQKLRAFRAENERAKRRFLKRYMNSEAPTEDSRYVRLEWEGGIIHTVLVERDLLREAPAAKKAA